MPPAAGHILTAQSNHCAGKPALIAGLVRQEGCINALRQLMPFLAHTPCEGHIAVHHGHAQTDGLPFRHGNVPEGRGVALVLRLEQGDNPAQPLIAGNMQVEVIVVVVVQDQPKPAA